MFELQMRTERKTFFRPVLFFSPLCACPMRKISLVTSEKREWKSGLMSLQNLLLDGSTGYLKKNLLYSGEHSGGGVMTLHDYGYLPPEFLESYPASE